ncbi:MAG: right-handed parallel beta-helix repeat-containing protein [Firmicutes bacterium]|nr:right-handed parallel beta-helix repeat-containing protein [Bacillota bacterium]
MIEKIPDDPTFYEQLANLLKEKGDEPAAIETLEQGIQNTGDESLSELLDEITGSGEAPALPDDGIARSVIEVRDAAHLLELVDFDNLPNLSNTELRLYDGVYDIGDNPIFLNGVENLSIVGTGNTEIVVQSSDELIIYIDGSKNVQLCGLTMGHSTDVKSFCTEGVICSYGTDVKIYNCDIYGCGVIGIYSAGDGLEVVNTIIRDCSSGGVTLFRGSASFSGCTFSGNSYEDKSQIISANGGAVVTLTGCKFIDNPAAQRIVASAATEWASASVVNETGTTESGNGWQ